jgi:peptidase M28-like protein
MNNHVLQTLLVGLIELGLAGPGAGQQRSGSAPVSISPVSISPARLRQDLYRLADDSMMGREPGSSGNWKATAYVAGVFRRLGLRPAGDSGTYFQRVPLSVTRVSERAVLEVDGTRLKPGSDFLPAIWLTTRPLRLDLAEAIYGGDARDSLHWIDGDRARGKVVVLDVRPDTAGKRAYVRTGALASDLRWRAAAALLILERDLLPPEVAEQIRSGILSAATSDSEKWVPPVFLLTPQAGAALFASPVPDLSPGTSGKRLRADSAISLSPTPYPARNVVAVLPGRDPRLRGEYISLSAHNDHVGFDHSPVDHDSIRAYNRVIRPLGADSPERDPTPQEWTRIQAEIRRLRMLRPLRADSIRNGADDDGSGTVALLELARAFARAKVRPRRSILFVSHTAEEYGLAGSAWFTDHPTVPLDSIIAEIDQDMVGRGNATDLPAGGPAYLEVVGAWRLSRRFGDLLVQVNRTLPEPLSFNTAYDAPGHPSQYYCRADHFNYARYGIPSVSLSRGEHLDYHQVTDEPQYIDYQALARVARLVYAVTLRLANEDARPSLDAPKPDPHAPCRQ